MIERAEEAGNLSAVSVPDLLGRYAAILQELRHRGVVRTRNAPLGDYAEYLAAQVYTGKLAANSVKSYDLLTTDGRRIQGRQGPSPRTHGRAPSSPPSAPSTSTLPC